MIGKLSVLGFSLVTALSGSALAHENCDPSSHGQAGHTGHAGHANSGGRHPVAAPVRQGDYSAASEVDLRRADLNHDGWVTLQEALDSGRQVFQHSDRDNDWVLSRYEVGRPALRRGDRNSDGRVSVREYQSALRARFISLDVNRDGVLARRELGLPPAYNARSAGYWPQR